MFQSVNQFCSAHGISRSLFYKLMAQNRGPQTITLGRRRLISAEAAEKWRRQIEGAAIVRQAIREAEEAAGKTR